MVVSVLLMFNKLINTARITLSFVSFTVKPPIEIFSLTNSQSFVSPFSSTLIPFIKSVRMIFILRIEGNQLCC